MRKHIIITILLLAVTAYVTVMYFRNLAPPGKNAGRIMQNIPANAALIFEFNNDAGFYDIFKGDTLFEDITGKQQFGELDTLRQTLLESNIFGKYFDGQDIFISFFPVKDTGITTLYTLSTARGFSVAASEVISKPATTDFVMTPIRIGGKPGYNIYIKALKKIFYLVNNEGNIYSGSFSKDLINLSSGYKPVKNRQSFLLLPDQQNANSLANIYVNYDTLNPLFDLLFSNKNTDIFKPFRLLPGMGALTLNYKTDALMFSGSTQLIAGQPSSFLSLFADQHPVVNHLKDIFPSTSAYGTNFSVSDPEGFTKKLYDWYGKAGLRNEENQLFAKIKAETGEDVRKTFDDLLGNEFAVVTTRYFEKYGLVTIKDGSRMNSLLTNLSKMTDENSGQLSYDKLPFFLLGDAFSVFRHPYFLIIDNYLVMANSEGELKSFRDTYLNQKFLSKNGQYQQLDALVAAQSNAAFFLVFKNAENIFKRDMFKNYFNSLENDNPGWNNFYGASWQLSAADKNFYTNFCLRLNTDTVKK
jgi:hypothetical protein